MESQALPPIDRNGPTKHWPTPRHFMHPGQGFDADPIEELAVLSDDLWELSSAVHRMQMSARPIKILIVPAAHVHKTAEVFRRIGVEGVVRDPMGQVVITVSASDIVPA
jgi:hypothetical protein